MLNSGVLQGILSIIHVHCKYGNLHKLFKHFILLKRYSIYAKLHEKKCKFTMHIVFSLLTCRNWIGTKQIWNTVFIINAINESIHYSVSQSVSQSVRQSVNQSVSQSVSQLINQSIIFIISVVSGILFTYCRCYNIIISEGQHLIQQTLFQKALKKEPLLQLEPYISQHMATY